MVWLERKEREEKREGGRRESSLGPVNRLGWGQDSGSETERARPS